MAKKVKVVLKLQIQAGRATPAPPIGPALGQHGVAIGEFVKQFNDATRSMGDDVIPVVVTVYEDRSFSFITKTPPASDLLKKAAGIGKGAANPLKDKVGSVTRAQVREIAERKMQDLNTTDIEAAMRMVEGTARNMGIMVKD